MIGKKSCTIRKISGFIIILLAILLCSGVTSANSKAALKLKYNGKQRKYYGKQVTSYVDGKKVSSSTKSIVLNGNVMVSYKDVFKSACKVKVTYKKSSGKLTFKANGKSVIMTIGKKTATVNGKKQTLKQPPLKVKYITKKTTKILVPAKVVAKGLGIDYTYNSSAKTISLINPFVLKYNGAEYIYKSYQGGLIYDNVTMDVSCMPLYKINGTVMLPGKEVLGDIMGLSYQYNPNSGVIDISNKFYSLQMKLGSTEAILTDLGNDNAVTNVVLKTAPLLVQRADTGFVSIMMPASQIVTLLGYYYSWDSNSKIALIHTKTYFDWKAKDTSYDAAKYNNALCRLKTYYDNSNNTTVVTFSFVNPIAEENIKVTEDASVNSIYFDFVNIYNLLYGKSEVVSAQNIGTFISEQKDNVCKVTMNNTDKLSYYHSVSGNDFIVYITENVSKDYALRLSKPLEVDFASLRVDDMYPENKFIITIPGNYTEYYKNNPIQKNTDTVTGIDITYIESDNTSNITLTMNKLQGCKLVNLGNYIGVIIDNPANVYNKIVVLDAGHGGKDPGAKNAGYNESDINLNVLYTYGKEYFNSSVSDVKAYWTRTTDVFITLDERAKFAAKIGADLFVSLHQNSSDNKSAKGTEVYYSNNNNKTNYFGLNSYKLATKCLDKLLPAMGTSSRGVKSNNYYVINHNTVPAVLIELGFISNSTDLSKITNPQLQKNAAKAIFDAVTESLSAK